MIMIRSQRLRILTTQFTHMSSFTNIECSLYLLCTVFSDKMYEKIRLRECSLEFTTRHVTIHEFFVLFTVLCALV
jgi:hypothetical protein